MANDCTNCVWARPIGHPDSETDQVAYCAAGHGALGIPVETQPGFVDAELMERKIALCQHNDDLNGLVRENHTNLLPDIDVAASPAFNRPEINWVGQTCDQCLFNKEGLCMKRGFLLEPEDERAETCGVRRYRVTSEMVPSWVEVTFRDQPSVQMPCDSAQPDPKPVPNFNKGPVLENGEIDPSVKTPPDQDHIFEAWRVIHTPKNGDVWIPVFRDEYIVERWGSDDALEFIPGRNPKDQFDPTVYVDWQSRLVKFAIQVYAADMNACLIGEPGTGKTEFVKYAAWLMNLPFTGLTFNSMSDPDSYLGTQGYSQELGTHVKPGILPRSIQKPGFVLCDELNLAEDAIQQGKRSLDDSGRYLMVEGQVFHRDQHCFVLSAINPAWDVRNIGTKVFSSADTRRMTFIRFEQPPKEITMRLVDKAVRDPNGDRLDHACIEAIALISEELKQAGRDMQIPDPWSLAQDIKVARLVHYEGLMGAYESAYLDGIETTQADNAKVIIKSHTPYGVSWT